MKPVLFALASAVVSASAIGAQVSIDAGPLVAYYRPTGQFDPGISNSKLPATPADLSGAAFGAEAMVRFGGRLGVLAQAVEAFSTIPDVPTPDGVDHGATSSHEYMATVAAVYDVIAASDQRLWVSAGPAVVRHGGDAYSPYGSPTQLGGAIGVGSTLRIGGHLRATGGVSAFLYELNIPLPAFEAKNPGSLERGAMHDMLVHASLTWTP